MAVNWFSRHTANLSTQNDTPSSHSQIQLWAYVEKIDDDILPIGYAQAGEIAEPGIAFSSTPKPRLSAEKRLPSSVASLVDLSN
jgi:hypothetical protein